MIDDVALINIVFTLFLLGIWALYFRRAYVLLWSGVYAASCVNAILNNHIHWFNDAGVYWVVVNLTSLIVQGFVVSGFRVRYGLQPLPASYIAFLVVSLIGTAWFTVVTPHFGLSMWFIPFAAFVMAAYVGWLLLRNEEHPPGWPEYAATGVFGIHGLAQLVASVVALAQGSVRDTALLDLYLSIIYLTLPSTFAAMGLIAVAIIAVDSSRSRNGGRPLGLSG